MVFKTREDISQSDISSITVHRSIANAASQISFDRRVRIVEVSGTVTAGNTISGKHPGDYSFIINEGYYNSHQLAEEIVTEYNTKYNAISKYLHIRYKDISNIWLIGTNTDFSFNDVTPISDGDQEYNLFSLLNLSDISINKAFKRQSTSASLTRNLDDGLSQLMQFFILSLIHI